MLMNTNKSTKRILNIEKPEKEGRVSMKKS